MRERRLFVRFTKVDEEKREVAGRLTQEIVDRDGEIWDYDASAPHMKAWSDSFKKATDGKSLGNLRAMHQPISAGKLTAIDFDDDEKAVDIVAKVVDDAEWDKVQEGVYTGFSLGGRVERSWKAAGESHKRFEVKPNEASLADYPCVPTATFDYVKVGGLVETRHFRKIADAPPAAAAATPRTSVMDVTRFADAVNKRLPLDTKAHVKLSLSAWSKSALRDKYSADEQSAITAQLVAAAKEQQLPNVTEKTVAAGAWAKGLYDVGQLASTISTLAWLQQCADSEAEYEGDESQVPDMLREHIAGLLETLNVMTVEEGQELLRMLGYEAAEGEAAKVAGGIKDAVAGSASTTTTSSMPTSEATVPKTETPVADAAATTETQKVAASGDFTKKMSKAALAKVADMADHAKVLHKMVGDHCEKLAGFMKDMGADGDAEDTTEKVATSSEFEKVQGERADWEKRALKAESERDAAIAERDAVAAKAEELAEEGDKILKALETRKGKLVSVSREADGVAALAPTSEKVVASAAAAVPVEAGTVNRTQLHQAFKKSFTAPRIDTGLPERATTDTVPATT